MGDQDRHCCQAVNDAFKPINIELANRIIMMGSQEEQLLDGVAMTTSISCSAQEEHHELRR